MKIVFFPAVNAAIFDAQGRVLLTRRSKKVRAPELWCLPGGHLDPGESWAQACAREVAEETGLKVGQGKLLGIYSERELNCVPHPEVPGGLGQFLTAVFIFHEFSGEIRPNDEVDDWGWFELSQPPTPLLGPHAIRLEDLQRFRGEAFVR